MNLCTYIALLLLNAVTGSGSGSAPRRASKKPKTVHAPSTYGHYYDEDIEAEEIMPAKTTKRSRNPNPNPNTGTSKGKQNVKTTTSGPLKSMMKIPLKQYSALRNVNPYVIEKNTRMCRNPKFYTKDQERIFNEIYGPKKKRFCEMFTINVEHMDAHPAYFGEAKEICEEFGLLPLMEFNHPFDEDLVAQFYATVKLIEAEDGARSLTWMTHDQVLSATWAEFAAGLGYSDLPKDTPGVFRVHVSDRPLSKDKMVDADLYIAGRALAGSAYNLKPIYDIMLRIYRSVLNPKVGNFDQVHGFLVNMMVLTAQKRGKGQQLDVMDYIWYELHYAIVGRKTPPFAPYIMRLLCKKWEDGDHGDLMQQVGRIIEHPVKDLTKKKHALPRFGPGAAEEEAESEDDADFDVPKSKVKKWFGKLTERVKASWCFKVDIQDKMYYQHQQDKKSRQRQKAIMRKMDLPVSDGSEEQITDKENWLSKQKWPESDVSSEEHEPWNCSPPPAHDNDDEEDDDDEEEDEE